MPCQMTTGLLKFIDIAVAPDFVVLSDHQVEIGAIWWAQILILNVGVADSEVEHFHVLQVCESCPAGG